MSKPLPNPERNVPLVTVSMDKSLAAEMRARAKLERRTISALVTLAVEEYLERAKPEATPRPRMMRPA